MSISKSAKIQKLFMIIMYKINCIYKCLNFSLLLKN